MHKYSLNAVWLTFEKVVRVLVTTFVGFYVVRYLGPQNFGALSYALAWLAILGALTGLGLDNIVLRELVRQPDKADAILSTGIGLKLTAAIITVVALFSLFFCFHAGAGVESILIVGFALVFQPMSVCEIFFQAKAASRSVVQIQVLQSFASSITKLLLVYLGASLEWFLWSYVFDALMLAFGIYVIAKRENNFHISFRKFDVAKAKKMLVMAFPLLLAGIATAIYMKIDLIMLESMVVPDLLGAYSAAAKLSESWYFIPVAICTALTPMLLAYQQESLVLFERKLKELYSTLIWGSVSVATLVTVLSVPLVKVIYGDKFLQAAELLAVHIWSGVFVCIGLVNSISLLSQDRLYQSLVRTVLGAIINVVLNLVWIPLWGALGAAYATLIAYAFTAWISIVCFKNGRHEFVLTLKSLRSLPKLVI